MESLRAYNLKLVANILPLHVAKHFLRNAGKKDEVIIFLQEITIYGKNVTCHLGVRLQGSEDCFCKRCASLQQLQRILHFAVLQE